MERLTVRSELTRGQMEIATKQLRVCTARNEVQFANLHIKDGDIQMSQLSYDL
jgi:hypothetical protein